MTVEGSSYQRDVTLLALKMMEKGGHEQRNVGGLEKLERSRKKVDSPLEPPHGNKYGVANMILVR